MIHSISIRRPSGVMVSPSSSIQHAACANLVFPQKGSASDYDELFISNQEVLGSIPRMVILFF